MSEIKNPTKDYSRFSVIALLAASFIMGYIDIIGAAIGYVQIDFSLTETLTKLIPTSVFIWFFLLSVPVSVFQRKVGIKKVLNLGLLITGISMLIPFIQYSYVLMIISFILLGIGNTILQVTINPMFHLIIGKDKYASFLSLSQFIKSLASFIGPVLTAWIAIHLGYWKYTFLVYGVSSSLIAIWFYFIPSPARQINSQQVVVKNPFHLLKNRFTSLMVLGIFLVVGIDVGINTSISGYFVSLFNYDTNRAVSTISIYFLAKMIGTFLGAIILRSINVRIFFKFTSATLVACIFLFIFSHSPILSQIYLFLIGLSAANIFPLIFSLTIQKNPDQLEELSGLMIMSVSGGALIPPLMGLISDFSGIRSSLFILVVCCVYLFLLSFQREKSLSPDF